MSKLICSICVAFLFGLGSLQASEKVEYALGHAEGLMWAIDMQNGNFLHAALDLQQKQIAMQDPRLTVSERKAYMTGWDVGSVELSRVIQTGTKRKK